MEWKWLLDIIAENERMGIQMAGLILLPLVKFSIYVGPSYLLRQFVGGQSGVNDMVRHVV